MQHFKETIDFCLHALLGDDFLEFLLKFLKHFRANIRFYYIVLKMEIIYFIFKNLHHFISTDQCCGVVVGA